MQSQTYGRRYLRSVHTPDFEVVRPHEDVCDTFTHIPYDPFIKSDRFVIGSGGALLGSGDKTVNALDTKIQRKLRNVILVWVYLCERGVFNMIVDSQGTQRPALRT